MDIVEQLRKCANTVYYQDGYTFRLGLQNEAADEIERLREALRLERQIKDAALALANDLQNQLNRMNGTYGFSVVAALKEGE